MCWHTIDTFHSQYLRLSYPLRSACFHLACFCFYCFMRCRLSRSYSFYRITLVYPVSVTWVIHFYPTLVIRAIHVYPTLVIRVTHFYPTLVIRVTHVVMRAAHVVIRVTYLLCDPLMFILLLYVLVCSSGLLNPLMLCPFWCLSVIFLRSLAISSSYLILFLNISVVLSPGCVFLLSLCVVLWCFAVLLLCFAVVLLGSSFVLSSRCVVLLWCVVSLHILSGSLLASSFCACILLSWSLLACILLGESLSPRILHAALISACVLLGVSLSTSCILLGSFAFAWFWAPIGALLVITTFTLCCCLSCSLVATCTLFLVYHKSCSHALTLSGYRRLFFCTSYWAGI